MPRYSRDESPLNGRFLSGYDRRSRRPRVAPPGPALQFSGGPVVRPELILEENELLPFVFLRTGDLRGRSVVKIVRGDGASGTGFLVGPDVLLTNHHVLPDPATAWAARAIALYDAERPEDLDPPVFPIEATLDPQSLFVTESGLDFTFCGVKGLEALGAIVLERDSRRVDASDPVNIIQHPRGRPKQVALRDNHVVKADRVVLQYACDTEPGSSGSPVFDNHWRLVALHHASVSAEGGKRVKGAPAGSRFLNEGIRISAIALWLESREAEQIAGPEVAARLRGLFRGLDPGAGFFGAIGRWLRGRSAAEFVSAGSRREGSELDVAFLNLKDARRPFPERLAGLGWALSDLGMDLWLLPHASAAEVRALAEHLDSHFRLDYRDLPPRPGDVPPVAVLHRRSRKLTVDRVEGCAGPDHLLVRSRGASGEWSAVRIVAAPRPGSIESIPPGSGDWLLIGQDVSAEAVASARRCSPG